MAFYLESDSSNGNLRYRLEGDVTDESVKESHEVAGKYSALTEPSAGIVDLGHGSG